MKMRGAGVRDYISLVKFSHTLFAMPFALIGFALSFAINDTPFTVRLLVLILLAMVSARNAAMGFNRYLDRDIDALNPRTKGREIPAGIISAKSALIFVVINCLIFVMVALLINRLCFVLAFPALGVLLGYSYMKRVSSLSHYVLGAALAIAPSGAYIAVTGRLDIAPVLLSFLVFFWVSGFDIIYSLSDVAFDRNNSLHSVPSAVGLKRALHISSAGHLMIVPLLALFYFEVNRDGGGLGWIYIIGSAIFLMLLLWQHLIVSPKDLSRVNAAFFTANGIASVIFALFTITDLII